MAQEGLDGIGIGERIGNFLQEAARTQLLKRVGAMMEVAFIALVAAVAGFAFLVVKGGTVPAWTLGATLLLAMALAIGLHLAHAAHTRGHRERVNELKATLEAANAELDRQNSYAANVGQALDHLQRIREEWNDPREAGREITRHGEPALRGERLSASAPDPAAQGPAPRACG